MCCRDAAQLFIGRHDFTQFANTFPHEVDPIKTIRSFNVTEVPTASHLIRLEVEGSGFLFRMVRHMVLLRLLLLQALIYVPSCTLH